MKNILKGVLVPLIMLSMTASVVAGPSAKAKKMVPSAETLAQEEPNYTYAKLGLLGTGLVFGGTIWAKSRAQELAKKRQKAEGVIKVLVEYGMPLTLACSLVTGGAYAHASLAGAGGGPETEADAEAEFERVMKQEDRARHEREVQEKMIREKQFDPQGRLSPIHLRNLRRSQAKDTSAKGLTEE
ncbi:MAG: hypothetical protein QG604_665 [Candidatus Dependentiae bacterium]|nr:hypothetical protein [Candidatus Dependentiae bacterium]